MSPLGRYWGAFGGVLALLLIAGLIPHEQGEIPAAVGPMIIGMIILGCYGYSVCCPKCKLALFKRSSGGSRGIATRYCPECGYDLTKRRYASERRTSS
jgi:hypothetical protein